ncbi:major facilitator superfamily domain-containing protein [Phyllosticta capitalensis]|uniref:Major facilitator superfamily domain-containing protein n=2 Tax=Phyllosticta capitalensis TaxID=121624 RepID=A0ABR1YBG6_9PEZI
MSTSNGDSIESRGPAVLVVTTAMIVCSTFFMVLRLASRIGIVKRTGWDDYFMIVAWVLAFGISFAICLGVRYGLGRHETDIPTSWDPRLRRLEYTFEALYNPCLMATKTSILVFYLTLAKSHRVFKWAVIATLAVVNLGGVALTLLNIFQCRPVGAAFANPTPADAHCTDIVTLFLSSSPLNIITDLAILFLPMPVLTSMRLPTKQKTILIITFGFGVFVAAVDVVRIAYLQSASESRLREIQYNEDSGNTRNYEETDFSWYISFSFMWSAIEVNVGIMCGCVPALKPLVSRFVPRILRDAGDTVHSLTHRRETFTNVDMANAQRLPSVADSTSPQLPQSEASQPEDPVEAIDFLTTPDMNELPRIERTATALTNSTRHTEAPAHTFFDFVKFKQKKSLVQMSAQESIFPIAMVTILFFVWGFAYGLLDILNQQFQSIARMSRGQTISIHSMYYVGYLVGPLTFGRILLKRCGFKACYIVGLCIYACGTLIFWPSAVLTSYPAFLISNFIVGLGLSTLEISANPFTILCGPPQYAEARLNFSQSVQAMGTVISPLLASKVLFKIDANSLIDVQWTYLGISLITVLLAVAYYWIPLPEATDTELDDAAERADGANHETIRLLPSTGIQVTMLTLAIGVFAQFTYVGAQECVATGFDVYVKAVFPSLDRVNHLAYAHTAFAVSRFVAGCLVLHPAIKPRQLLLFCFIAFIALSAVALRNPSPTTSATAVVLLFFAEAPIFSLIFAQCLRGLGSRVKSASAILAAAISGGGAFPPIYFAVARNSPRGREADYPFAYCVPIAAAVAGILFPLYLNSTSKAKAIVDPFASRPPFPQHRASQRDLRRAAAAAAASSRANAMAPRPGVDDDDLDMDDDDATFSHDNTTTTNHRDESPGTNATLTPSGTALAHVHPRFKTSPKSSSSGGEKKRWSSRSSGHDGNRTNGSAWWAWARSTWRRPPWLCAASSSDGNRGGGPATGKLKLVWGFSQPAKGRSRQQLRQRHHSQSQARQQQQQQQRNREDRLDRNDDDGHRVDVDVEQGLGVTTEPASPPPPPQQHQTQHQNQNQPDCPNNDNANNNTTSAHAPSDNSLSHTPATEPAPATERGGDTRRDSRTQHRRRSSRSWRWSELTAWGS